MHSDAATRKLYVFDCDGVLVDTNETKLGFVHIVLAELDLPKDFISWAVESFRDNFGLTRQAHFERFKRQADQYNIGVPADLVERGVSRYSMLVAKLYSQCDLIEESCRYINTLNPADIFVVSASNQEELRQELPKRYLNIERGHIFGGPTSKVNNLLQLKSLYPKSEIQFFGDSHLDAHAAAETGTAFTGVSKYSAAPDLLITECMKHSFRVIPTLS